MKNKTLGFIVVVLLLFLIMVLNLVYYSELGSSPSTQVDGIVDKPKTQDTIAVAQKVPTFSSKVKASKNQYLQAEFFHLIDSIALDSAECELAALDFALEDSGTFLTLFLRSVPAKDSLNTKEYQVSYSVSDTLNRFIDTGITTTFFIAKKIHKDTGVQYFSLKSEDSVTTFVGMRDIEFLLRTIKKSGYENSRNK